jgi:hypothetical protein
VLGDLEAMGPSQIEIASKSKDRQTETVLNMVSLTSYQTEPAAQWIYG